METWRIFLAVTLMLGVIVLTNVLFPPATPQDVGPFSPDSTSIEGPPILDPVPPALPGAEADPPASDQSTRVEADQDSTASPAGTDAPTDGAATPTDGPPAREIVVESPLYRYRIATRGAALAGAELLEYESFTDSGAVELAVDSLGPLIGYGLRAAGQEGSLAAVAFDSDAPDTVRLSPGAEREVVLRAVLAGGGEAEIVYGFSADEYAIDVRGDADLGGLTDQTSLLIQFSPTLAINEEDAREDSRNLAYVTNAVQGGIHSVALSKVEEPTVVEGPLLWAAVKNKYFVTAAFGSLETERLLGGLLVGPAPGDDAASLAATLPLERGGSFAFRLYVGPQEAERLAAMGSQFADVNPLGFAFLKAIIQPLARVATWALVGMHRVTGLAYGWVVILFGVFINILIWPFNMKAMRSQLRNMEVQPRMKAIQEEYKDRPDMLQKEMMRLYKEEGFNPFGGCLPMLIPMPVLFTLFFVFQETIEFRGKEFLWLPDLSRPDPLYIIPVLMALSMFVLQYVSYRSTPEPNPQLKLMMWFMPIFMLVILLNFASGLNLYYASSNVARLPQQLYIMKERQKVHAKQAIRKAREERENGSAAAAGGGSDTSDPPKGGGSSKGGSSSKGRGGRRKRKSRRK